MKDMHDLPPHDNAHARLRSGARIFWLAAVATAGILALTATMASASIVQEEQQGSQVLRELERGKLQCKDAGAAEFETVGEYVMGRMLGSASAHEAMNQVMSRMMGPRNEPLMHEVMGRRFAGCAGGHLPSGFGLMMGAFNAMGMMGGGVRQGEGEGPYGTSGSMMDGRSLQSSAGDDDFNGPSAVAMIGMMAVLIGAVALAIFWFTRRQPRSPMDVLEQRYARGELSAEEYQQRQHLLGGSSR